MKKMFMLALLTPLLICCGTNTTHTSSSSSPSLPTSSPEEGAPTKYFLDYVPEEISVNRADAFNLNYIILSNKEIITAEFVGFDVKISLAEIKSQSIVNSFTKIVNGETYFAVHLAIDYFYPSSTTIQYKFINFKINDLIIEFDLEDKTQKLTKNSLISNNEIVITGVYQNKETSENRIDSVTLTRSITPKIIVEIGSLSSNIFTSSEQLTSDFSNMLVDETKNSFTITDINENNSFIKDVFISIDYRCDFDPTETIKNYRQHIYFFDYDETINFVAPFSYGRLV